MLNYLLFIVNDPILGKKSFYFPNSNDAPVINYPKTPQSTQKTGKLAPFFSKR